jgi:hypothetical protein
MQRELRLLSYGDAAGGLDHLDGSRSAARTSKIESEQRMIYTFEVRCLISYDAGLSHVP